MRKVTASDVTNHISTRCALGVACMVTAPHMAVAVSAHAGTDITLRRYLATAAIVLEKSVAWSEFGFHTWRKRKRNAMPCFGWEVAAFERVSPIRPSD